MKRIFNYISKNIQSLLKQGITPAKLAAAVTAGFVIGIMPVLGVPTPLCIVFAGYFRLNQLAIQIGNYVAYPLQIIMFYPFMYLGSFLVFKDMQISWSSVQTIIKAGVTMTELFTLSGVYIVQGLIAWALSIPLFILVLYPATNMLLKRFHSSDKQSYS